MGKYVLVYTGGGMAEGAEEQQKAMEAWMGWFGELGADVVDHGNPFGPAVTVAADGSSSDGAPGKLTGYSIINAESIADAASKAKGCPVLSSGGAVEVYEAVPM